MTDDHASDWTAAALITATLTPCPHRTGAPCTGCELKQRKQLLTEWCQRLARK